MKAVKKREFNQRMQVLGFENRETKLIWKVMTTESKPVASEEFANAIEFLKLKHS